MRAVQPPFVVRTTNLHPAVSAFDTGGGSRADLVRDFLNYCRFEQHLSENTIRNYQYDIQKLDRFLEMNSHANSFEVRTRTFNDVDRATLRAFLAHMHAEGRAIASIRRTMAAIKQFFRFLSTEGHITSNPVEFMPRMKVPQRLPRYLPWEQVERLIQAPLERQKRDGRGPVLSEPARYRNHALLMLLAATGIRISEAVDLKVEDVGYLGTQPHVRVTGKGDKQRVVPLHDRAAAVLKDYIDNWRLEQVPGHRRRLRAAKSPYVFINRDGEQVSRRIVQVDIQRYALRAGIEGRVYPHLLRHSFATALVEQGCPIEVVQQLLGHVSIATTQIYAHVSTERLRASYMQYHPAGRG
jgi:site-specific recombinase XerD